MRTRITRLLSVLCVCAVAGLMGAAPQNQPEVKKRVEPWYPTILKEAGIQGMAYLKVVIDEKGHVSEAETLKTDHPAFGEAALKAITQWEFSPATKDGKPIKAEVTIPFRFALAEKMTKSRHEELLRLQDRVKNFLRGENEESLKEFVNPSAYVVVGNKQEHLGTLLSDKGKWTLLVEGKGSTFESSRSIVGDAGDMAYLVLKTKPVSGKPERYHTVVFLKSREGKWTISAWQAGS